MNNFIASIKQQQQVSKTWEKKKTATTSEELNLWVEKGIKSPFLHESLHSTGLHEWGEEGRPEVDGEGERQGGIGGVGWGGALACCSGLGSSQKDFHTVPAYVSHAEKRFQSFDSATL